jgi:hypothetical protein
MPVSQHHYVVFTLYFLERWHQVFLANRSAGSAPGPATVARVTR